MASYKIRKTMRQRYSDEEEVEEETDFSFGSAEIEKGAEAEFSDVNMADVSAIEQLIESGEGEKVSRGMREIKNLKESAWLEYFASTSAIPESRLAAVNALGLKADALKSVAETSEHHDSRAVALDRLAGMMDELDDEGALALLANEHDSSEVRVSAASRIENTNALREITSKSSFEDSRWVALRKLKEAGTENAERKYNMVRLGKDIFAQNSDKEEAVSSMKRMAENYKTIRNLCAKEELGELASMAMSDVGTYTNVIACAACFSMHKECRVMAIKTLANDPDALLEINIHSSYPDTGTAAMNRLDSMVERIDDQGILFQMARRSTNWSKAIDQIDSAPTLVKLFKTLRGGERKKAVMEKLDAMVDDISDHGTLELISKFSKSTDAKRVAKRRMRLAKLGGGSGTISAIKRASGTRDEDEEEEQTSRPQPSSARFESQSFESDGTFVGKIKAIFKEFIGF